MDWIERLNLSIDYIEEHLTGEVDVEEAAKVALCSSYYFQRMFAYMSEMTLAEYVRRWLPVVPKNKKGTYRRPLMLTADFSLRKLMCRQPRPMRSDFLDKRGAAR